MGAETGFGRTSHEVDVTRCPPCPKRTLAGRETLWKNSAVSDFHYQARGRNFAVGDVVIDVLASQMLAGLI